MGANFAVLRGAAESGNEVALQALSLVQSFHQPTGAVHGDEACSAHAAHIHAALTDEARPIASLEELERLLRSVRANAHNVSVQHDPAIVAWRSPAATIGLGMFFWLHLANHSCMPNAFFTATSADGPEGGTAIATLYALRNIDEGEEVFISYIDGATLLSPVHTRRRALLQHFGFVCMCSRCCAEASN